MERLLVGTVVTEEHEEKLKQVIALVGRLQRQRERQVALLCDLIRVYGDHTVACQLKTGKITREDPRYNENRWWDYTDKANSWHVIKIKDRVCTCYWEATLAHINKSSPEFTACAQCKEKTKTSELSIMSLCKKCSPQQSGSETGETT